MENTQKEREYQITQILWKLYPYQHNRQQTKDVVSACYRFLLKWETKGYYIKSLFNLVEHANMTWDVCKESKWEHAYKTLYQRLNEDKTFFIEK
jgi:hypothetical protein